MALAFWVCTTITCISALVSLGYSISGARTATTNEGDGYMYALARSVALAVVAVAAFFIHSVSFTIAIAVAMVIVQGLDAVVGARTHDPLKSYGPAVTALVNTIALIWLLLAV